MDLREPESPGIQSDTRSSTVTANSSPPYTPELKNDNQNKRPPTGINLPVPGWPSLARSIAKRPAFEAFPSFTDLNVKSLLYYEAQLILLRKKLHDAECDDYYNGDQLQQSYSQSMELLIESAEDSGMIPPGQWSLIEEIRTVLAKYNAALIQFSQVSTFPDADSCTVQCLRKCARKGGSDDSALEGAGSWIWGPLDHAQDEAPSFWGLLLSLVRGSSKSQKDERAALPEEFPEHLIVPRGEKKRDGLTSWVEQRFIPLYHFLWIRCPKTTWKSPWQLFKRQLCLCKLPKCFEKRGSDAPNVYPSKKKGSNDIDNGNFTAYSDVWIFRVTSILTTIVACILPVIAIIILSRVHTMGMILGLIALFNIIFAFGLAMISTDSSRTDIFTATAAFSAVMVVFVQNKISQQ